MTDRELELFESRRVRIVRLTAEFCLSMLSGHVAAEVVENPLPEDVVAVGVIPTPAVENHLDGLPVMSSGPAASVSLVIWSSTFEPLEPGAVIPVLPPMVFRRLEGV